MRRSPRRPLILKRRKLPFQQNDPPTAKPQTPAEVAPEPKAPSKASTNQAFLDGVRVMDHPSMSHTQVVVIPKTADLQSVIGALTAKGKEHGPRGPNKFILLSGSDCHDNGSLCQAAAEGQGSASASMCGQPVKPESVCHTPDVKPLSGSKTLNKELDCSPLDESLTNIQWLGGMSSRAMDSNPAQQNADKENQNPIPQTLQTPAAPVDTEATPRQPMSERPPYSYMAMIQFAINSRKNRRMTLKDIYNWIEDHFPYFREVAKPGWKNSIRHNLSLHDMFTRETSTDGKVSFWTIRPEANRCLTLDQVFKPDSDPITTPVPVSMLLLPQQPQKRMLPDSRKKPTVSEKRMKPLLPRTDSYLVPIQLPVNPSIYLPPSSSPQFSLSGPQQRRSAPRGTKRVRIAPKVTHSDAPRGVERRSEGMELKTEIKEEAVQVPIRPETPKAPPRRQSSSSRRKQRLVHSTNDEPVLVCPDNTFLDSGVALDTSTFHERQGAEPDEQPDEQHSPDREFSFKTPIKSTSHLVSSTPSKPPSSVPPETWKVTPLGKGGQSILDFSPIRTPGGPAVTPRHDYTTFSFNGTPFKDLPLFSSPRELLSSSSSAAGSAESPVAGPPSGCSTPGNRSLTEGLILDTMNDSLSKILVDISFSGLYDDDLGTANISWSELIPQLK